MSEDGGDDGGGGGDDAAEERRKAVQSLPKPEYAGTLSTNTHTP
jgi:hypothetical protein